MNGRFTVYKYDVEACWYGNKPSGTAPDKECFKSALSGLRKWVSSVSSISETAIGNDSFYVKECVGDNNGHYVVILWQPTSKDATSTALDILSKPGDEARIKQHNYPSGYKPGCPLYYYVDTQDLAVYILKPDNATIIGKDVYEQLMRYVMVFHSGVLQQVLKDPSGESLVLGDVDASPKKHGVFRLAQCLCAAQINEIISRAPDIRKMVHTVSLDDQTRFIFEAFMSNLMEHLGISIASSIEKGARSIRYEANVDLDEQSLMTLIRHQQDVGGLERIGFVVRDNGNPRTLWADKAGNQQFVIPRIQPAKGVYVGSELLKAVPKFIRRMPK